MSSWSCGSLTGKVYDKMHSSYRYTYRNSLLNYSFLYSTHILMNSSLHAPAVLHLRNSAHWESSMYLQVYIKSRFLQMQCASPICSLCSLHLRAFWQAGFRFQLALPRLTHLALTSLGLSFPIFKWRSWTEWPWSFYHLYNSMGNGSVMNLNSLTQKKTWAVKQLQAYRS